MNLKKFSPLFLGLTVTVSLQSPVALAMVAQQAPMLPMPAQQLPGMPPAQQMPGSPTGQPQLSLEDLQAMEQFVEAERAKMTDEQRAQFDADVVQLTKEFEKMQQENPEQFNTFIDQMLFGQPTDEPTEQPLVPAQQPEAIPVPAQQPEESAKAQENKEKQEEALKRINTIIKHTNSFLNKTAIMVEFPGKLKKWAEQGKIKGWIPGYAWESVKNNVGIKEQIEKLLQKLNAIKEQDRATKTYKYLDAVIANEALYKNLGILERKLKELEPQVEIDEFGLEPVSKEVRAIMRTILGDYLHALFALSIPQDIDAVIASFEPTAKKYRDEEETSSKKAIEDSKRVRPAQGTVVAGARESDAYQPTAGGMNPYDYFPYSGQSYQPQQSPSDSSAQRSETAKRDDDKKKATGGREGGQEPSSKSQEETKDSGDDKKIRKSIEQLEGNLTEAAQAIDSMNERPATAPIKAEDLATAVKKLKQATGNLNSLKIRMSKASTDKKRGRFKEEVREAYNLQRETLSSASKISGAITGGKKPQATTNLPPAPTRKTVSLSQEEVSNLKVYAAKVVDEEIKRGVNTDISNAAYRFKLQEATADVPAAPELTEDTIKAGYEEIRPELVEAKWQQAIKERLQSEQTKADEKYEKEKADWDAQVAKQVPESKEEEVYSYSLQDLNNAVQEVQRAFNGF